MKRILSEPLVHFLAIGLVLFAAGVYLEQPAPSSRDIVVTPGVVEHLAAGFSRTWQRPPTEDELRALVDEHVREEVYYREALALGLDRDDPIVRRRMRQKIEFLTDSMDEIEAPPDSVLRAHMDENADEYEVEPRVAFRHVYFSRDRRGTNAESDAASFLTRASGRAPSSVPGDAGDPFLMPLEVELSRASEISRMFGRDFTEQVLELEPGRWAGPVRSAYGLHVVWVHERSDPRWPDLSEVRDQVLHDWQRSRREERSEVIYERLREKYRVSIQWSPEASS